MSNHQSYIKRQIQNVLKIPPNYKEKYFKKKKSLLKTLLIELLLLKSIKLTCVSNRGLNE